MSNALFITAEARENLEEIADALASWTGDADTGEAFIQRILAKCDRLAGLDGQLGRSRDEFGLGLRSSPVGHYLILFRYEGHELVVVAVVDGQRDLSRTFAANEGSND